MAANDEMEILGDGEHVLPKYPPDHQVGMEVPVGGSNCDKCEYLAGPRKCGEEKFIEWNGSEKIPLPTDRYCCDFFAVKGKREGKRDVPSKRGEK